MLEEEGMKSTEVREDLFLRLGNKVLIFHDNLSKFISVNTAYATFLGRSLSTNPTAKRSGTEMEYSFASKFGNMADFQEWSTV